MKTILLLAYQLSPFRGSEYSVGWNHVINMSKYYKLKVIVGASDDHMGEFSEIKSFLDKNGEIPNVEFLLVNPGLLGRALNYANKYNFFKYSFYIAYKYWHLKAYKKAKKILENYNVDIIHYLNPIGYREPGNLWKFRKAYIWGPISGFSSMKTFKSPFFSKSGHLMISLKNAFNYIQKNYSSKVKKALSNSTIVVAATNESKYFLEKKFKIHSYHIPENAIQCKDIKVTKKNMNFFKMGDCLNIIWIGAIDSRKCLDLAIKSVSHIKNKNFKLDVVGSGPDMNKCKKYSEDLGLDKKIIFHGHVSRKDVYKLLTNADLHLITSRSEGNPTTLWEAMSFAIPTLSLKHSGMADTITNKSGVLVDVDKEKDISFELANAIETLQLNPNKLNSYKVEVIESRDAFAWESRIKRWNEIYEEAYRIHNHK